MKNVLMIMKPRNIEIAIKSLSSLKIDKVWFESFSEVELEFQINNFINNTNYDNYILVSDDVIVKQSALDRVQELLEHHELATGYCLLYKTSEFFNITKNPVRKQNNVSAEWCDYDFFTQKDLNQVPDIFDTWFAGWAITGMRRDLWIEYPFKTNYANEAQSDVELCWRTAAKGLLFKCHKEAYIEHLKETYISIPLEKNMKQQVKFDFYGNKIIKH